MECFCATNAFKSFDSITEKQLEEIKKLKNVDEIYYHNQNLTVIYKKGKNKLYDIVVEQESYLTFENSSFLKKVNENSVTKLVASLYHSRCISKKDLQELAEFIEKSAEGDENV